MTLPVGKNGVREVTLLGQNVNSFGKGNEDLLRREPRKLTSPIGRVGPALGEENFPSSCTRWKRTSAWRRCGVCASPRAIHWISATSFWIVTAPFPVWPHTCICRCRAARMPCFNAVGRHHKIETYLRQMERLRDFVPEIGLSTDIIVGFPGRNGRRFSGHASNARSPSARQCICVCLLVPARHARRKASG